MDQVQQPGDEERIETPADRAEKEGIEELSIHRWTDAELRQLAKDKGIPNPDPLTRAELIEILEASK